ncbi:chemotaxis protein CheA [Polaromonas sp. JS666]|uniref:chemotaxis protein CheA n=1 Tax=Polaromonas sp. (strain JS666 / ATCC BAA-500) TaxID=296591 RepID=UPI00088301C6|nr:chemotaxis protein CheA [Polaromonas sp. JS666]SDN43014.1 CheA signal transduction histidine kinase [Polaromonas sp. JS666]
MDITQFYQTFFEEADELLAEMEQLFLGLDLEAPDGEHLNAVFRAAHSIKGGAATFGFAALTDTTHLLENLLDRARHGELKLNTKMMDAFLETKDVLQKQLSAYRAGAEPEAGMVAEICAVLQQLALEAGGTPPAPPVIAAPPAPAPVAQPQAEPVAATERTLKVRFSKVSENDCKLLSEEMANLGQVTAQTQEEGSLTIWLKTGCDGNDVIAVCCFIIEAEQIDIHEEGAPAAPAQPVAAPQAEAAAPQPASQSAPAAAGAPAPAAAAVQNKESSSIRVDVEKVDQIINLVGELVITQSMLTQTASLLDPVVHERLLSGMGHLERNARDLQESVMSIRMMPMDYVFSRFPRLIRDLSAKLGKQVQLVTVGKETELDKSLIERIIDPITHLVRNSLDHGIEGPERRAYAGKDPVGRLTLSAQHQGGSIVIEVKDDGGGLVREKILAKALQQGMPVSESMPDEDVWQLIFAPGFSTAEAVTDVSGRGVGMDVVKRNIHEMGGHVEIASVQGKGTTIRIVLPLTLAILNGMSVKVGEEVYILPLNYVIESLQPLDKDVHSITADEHVMHVRGEYLALLELHKLFDVAGAVRVPTQGIAVIVQAEGTRFALLVDQLVGQHQVVVKNLETNYRKVPGISGATILGDGNVALIIDVAAVQRANRDKAAQRGQARPALVAAAAAAASRALEVAMAA